MSEAKKGFTLVELLVVIAIIGILARVIIVSANYARNKAVASNTKTTITTLKTSISTCCGDPTNHLQDVSGGDVCDTGAVAILPDTAILNVTGVTYTVINDCDQDNPAIDVEIAGHAQTECNAHVSVTQQGIFSGGDASTVGTISGFPSGC